MKFYIHTFGCQMNANDSEWIGRALEAQGHEPTPFEDDADFFLVNTCSVRDKPEQKVYSLLGRMRRHWERDPSVFVAVGGCVAQQVGEEFFRRFPFVRLVYGTDATVNAPQAIERVIAEPRLRLSLLDFSEDYTERDPHGEVMDPERLGGKAFVNIMQGCDNFCAYCIVPYVRGRQKSRSSERILEECRLLAENGVREISLLGQNVNSYGLDSHGDGTSFAQLLRRVAAIDGLERIRFTTSHPKDIADEVVEAFGELSNLCPQLHLPLQSGSDRILSAMGRKYDLARYMGIVDRLRDARPDIALTTDLIVGFPGETEEDFELTLEAMRRVRYVNSFSFRYSDRPGVRAETLPDKVPSDVAAERLIILQALQHEHARHDLENMVGREVTVLFEGESHKQDRVPDAWRGHDEYLHPVNVPFKGEGPLTGRLAQVRITVAKKHCLIGELTGEAW